MTNYNERLDEQNLLKAMMTLTEQDKELDLSHLRDTEIKYGPIKEGTHDHLRDCRSIR